MGKGTFLPDVPYGGDVRKEEECQGNASVNAIAELNGSNQVD